MTAAGCAVCVTGGTGFIGAHLVDYLLERGDGEVRVLTRGGAVPAGAVVVPGDLVDAASLSGFVTPGATVIHLAYAARALPEANLVMAENLATACRAGGAQRLVHCSTAAVAGRAAPHTIDESTECVPVSAYQRTKLRIERHLQAQLHDVCPVTILRPTAVLGRGGANLRATIDALRREPWLLGALKNALLAERRTHLVCVENVVAAFELAVEGRIAAGTFIVSDDASPDNDRGRVCAILAEELGARPFPAIRLPFGNLAAAGVLRLAGRIDVDPRRIYCDRRLRDQGYQPVLELGEGIRRFARWYTQRGGVA